MRAITANEDLDPFQLERLAQVPECVTDRAKSSVSVTRSDPPLYTQLAEQMRSMLSSPERQSRPEDGERADIDLAADDIDGRIQDSVAAFQALHGESAHEDGDEDEEKEDEGEDDDGDTIALDYNA